MLALHAFKCGSVLDALEEVASQATRSGGLLPPPPPLILVLGGTDVNVDAARSSEARDALARRARSATRVVAFSSSMVAAAPPGTLPPAPKTVVIPQGVDIPIDAPPEDPRLLRDNNNKNTTALPLVSLHEDLGVGPETPVLLLPAGKINPQT